MQILLVNMPWASIDLPSLALGILKRSVDERVPDSHAEVMHANIDYVDWVTGRTGFTLRDYEYYSLASYFLGCGDWVFSSALYGDPGWRVEEFTEATRARLSEDRLEQARMLHTVAEEFVLDVARRVVDLAPDVVGFTSTFQQNTAALAAARHVKRLAPGIVTVLGGANCDGKQGEALHRNFTFVDHVVRGEAEESFPALLAAIGRKEEPAGVPGICWRDGLSRSVVNPMNTRPLPPAAILPPDYTGYFERLASSRARSWVEPKLVVEGARGCWWGEKHHCTFCGLNGSSMQFRSKNPGVFFEEIVELARRHRVLDMYVVDNILDMNYLKSLLPRLKESGYDLRLQYEIKSNMRLNQLRTLAEAGVVYVQPGIENLNSKVLALMDKGVTGCQNVRMLRDAATAGLTVAWNYLHGFPGEEAGDYDDAVAQMPALEHLNPPASQSARIAVERFSPYFDNPGLGFSELRPAQQYRFIFDLPEAELFDLAYIFDVPPRGIADEVVDRLNAAVATWQRAYAGSRLTHCDFGDRIVLVSRRRAFDWTVLELTGPEETALFRLLDQPHTVTAAARKLRAAAGAGADRAPAGPGDPGEDRVRQTLRHWRSLGLVYEDGGQYVHVAPASVNQELLRLGYLKENDAREAADLAARLESAPA
ncbi:RiPP maturation radical SAM C-methyltransferase [Streptomyces albireticuli]|uniref:B12-binding domain-containing radical SAM protein n=1 Tax=Streptomyces albireticuli TaxID=1940 RepID=A0A2A2DA85_9ACTN|nr:RiPP maturation radical SAM C-methyltransferase [Streptomyces albireticuli]MCD9144964.1 RiPP maturation radical SAM C-methyltransferase [Streptomyces albireticuli]MCD9164390.1 RiPP maturation radical SAM C-methyltransferase [Streptomyces albireticuli]MCD9194101.1 RiPP maturation radical SAM C-methyltransferase [Streptomyces albireticuli]PAU49393.1 B12-binding domain-containing radical SAM protein [Streptomyces albireticuli]